MITQLKIFESIWDIPDEIVDTPEGFKRCISAHLSSKLSNKNSYKLVESAQSFFNWKIPESLKYKGSVYRVIQFSYEFQYDKALKENIKPYELQRYWSCSKDLESIERVKFFTNGVHGCMYKYFITVKFDVNYDNILFDMNKMNEYLGNDKDAYHSENEVLVLTLNLPEITPKNIVEHGEIVRGKHIPPGIL